MAHVVDDTLRLQGVACSNARPQKTNISWGMRLPCRSRANQEFSNFRLLSIWHNEPGEGKDLVDALLNQYKTPARKQQQDEA